MERVTFLIEQTGKQVACLLNPESLVVRRKAGVRTRESATGQLTETGLTDRPLLFTGGGATEIELDLLFDIDLAGSSIAARNVRDLTTPLWNLAENDAVTGYGMPPLVRLIWGKTFNLPGIVAGVAEHLERFTADGIPHRSWMRLRLIRVDEGAFERSRPVGAPSLDSIRTTASGASPEAAVHTLSGGVQGQTPDEEARSSVATASSIAESAFFSSGAASMLSAAQSALSGAVSNLSDGASQLAESEEEDASAREKIQGAAETIGRAMGSAIQGIRSGNLTEVGAAIEQMFSASSSAAQVIGSLASSGGRAVAREVKRTLDTIGPAAEKLLTAGQIVAREIVRTSARVIAGAVTRTTQAVDRVAATADRLGSAVHEGARKAGDMLKSGLDEIRVALDRIRTAGEFAAVNLFPKAFDQLSRTVEQLWSAGRATAAEGVSRAIEEMAFRLKNMKAASEAIRSVMEHGISSLAQSVVAGLKSALAAARTSGEFTGLDTFASQLQLIAESALSPESGNGHDDAHAAVQSLEEKLRTVLDSGVASRLNEVEDVLPAVEKAIKDLELAEQEEASEAITTAVRIREEPPPDETALPDDDDAVAYRRRQGERLDQTAFRHYGNPAYWRLLALYNDIDHPLRLPVGLQLTIPPATR